jgi:hypothetical protein
VYFPLCLYVSVSVCVFCVLCVSFLQANRATQVFVQSKSFEVDELGSYMHKTLNMGTLTPHHTYTQYITPTQHHTYSHNTSHLHIMHHTCSHTIRDTNDTHIQSVRTRTVLDTSTLTQSLTFYVLSFVFCVLCSVFCVLCSVFCVLCVVSLCCAVLCCVVLCCSGLRGGLVSSVP